jgi:hypothetical protein
MKIIKWLLVLMLAGFTYGQGNLYFTSDTTGTSTNTEDSIKIDLGFDTEVILSEYGYVQQEARAVAMYRTGTWTNDSLGVYAAVAADSPYVPVYFNESALYIVGSTGGDYIEFDPRHFAGIRYLMFNMPAAEAANRVFTIVRRRY